MYTGFSARSSSKRIYYCRSVLIAIATVTLVSCSAIPSSSNKKWSEFTGKVDAHGALPVMHHEFNILPFVEMLEGAEGGVSTCMAKTNSGDVDPSSYQCAIKKFYIRTHLLSESYQRMERNRIQEHILAISEDRCNAYKRYLRYDQSMSDFWLGFGSTFAGGLGALSGSLPAAKTFAAFGGVLSGVKAEYNQDFYGNLFYSVITKAIDEQRKDAYRQIQTHGQNKSLVQYPVEAAIKDAILYDGTCSAVSAMEYAEKAVQLVNDPGMDGMMRFLLKANQSRFILQNGIKDVSELKKAGITASFENSRYGSQISGKDVEDINPQSNIMMQLLTANQLTAEKLLDEIGHQYTGNDKNKQDSWEKFDKSQLTSSIKTKLDPVLNDYKTSLLSCSKPVATQISNYMTSESALQKADDQNLKDLQIKRDQAFNKVEQINVEINGIGQQFQTLISSLTKAGVKAVANTPPQNTVDWDYSNDVKLKGDNACTSFN